VNVTVAAIPPTVHIETPVAASALSGVVAISGWAVDNSSLVGTAISSVQVLVDGAFVGYAIGLVVALSLVGLVLALARRGAPQGWLRKVTALAVLGLYLWGVDCAYHVSGALNRSSRWASIHCLYSWPYVGVYFAEWATSHPKQPLGKTLRQFRGLMGM
jgi:hypothetical protein